MATASKAKEIALSKEEESTSCFRYLTGCDLIDLVVGGSKGVYGFAPGTINNIIGDKSAGKSFLKNEIIAKNYSVCKKSKLPLKYFSDDTESGDTFDTANLYGFDVHPTGRKIGKIEVCDSETVESLEAQMSSFWDQVDEGEMSIYAVDSLDGLSDASKKKEAAKRMSQLAAGKEVKDDGSYGTAMAKFLSQSLFKNQHKQIKRSQGLALIVSQTREKLNAAPFQSKLSVSGGSALTFYCHTRVVLSTLAKIKKGGKIIGAVVRLETIKSKTPRPYRSCVFSLYFEYGIDNIGSNLDYLYDLRNDRGDLVSSVCNSISWDTKEEKNFRTLQAWLKSTGLDVQAKKDAKLDGVSLSKDWILEWIQKDPELISKMNDHFGISARRDELIAQIENDPKMDAELTRRVRDKWEGQEAACLLGRKKKYV